MTHRWIAWARVEVARILGTPDRIIYSNEAHDPLFERVFGDLFQQYRDARIGVVHRDPATHRARADHCRLGDLARWRVRGNVGNLAHLALTEEHVDQRLRLRRPQTLHEQLRCLGARFLERHLRRRFDRVD